MNSSEKFITTYSCKDKSTIIGKNYETKICIYRVQSSRFKGQHSESWYSLKMKGRMTSRTRKRTDTHTHKCTLKYTHVHVHAQVYTQTRTYKHTPAEALARMHTRMFHSKEDTQTDCMNPLTSSFLTLTISFIVVLVFFFVILHFVRPAKLLVLHIQIISGHGT